MRWPAVFDRLAPDFIGTVQRFPLAVLLCLVETALVVALANADGLETEPWMRLVAGVGTAALFATAGTLLRESGAGRVFALLAEWIVPALVFIAWQFDVFGWYIPYALPFVGVLYLSVAPTWPRRDEVDAEARFWWINHQAVTTAIVAGAAFLLITLGLLAIERSVSLLFSIQLGTLVYRWLLPIAGLLLLPVYWLSTLPRLDSFRSEMLETPDFLARAAGFLGQFVLAPLLAAYALILLAYTVQIVVQQAMPVGVLGWMVLSFVIGGAATYLLVWPPFMRQRWIARHFLRWWFWATLIPLALFAVAVVLRVEAYGFTPERIGLVLGGVWAGSLAIAFILRRGDIRMIPGFAAALLLLASIGPWNVQDGPIWSQSARLERAMIAAGATSGSAIDWPAGQAAIARSALAFLSDARGRESTRSLLARHGYEVPPLAQFDMSRAYALLGLRAGEASALFTSAQLRRNSGSSLQLDAGARFIGPLTVTTGGADSRSGLTLRVEQGVLTAALTDGPTHSVPLADWLDTQSSELEIDRPELRFEVGGRRFLLIVEAASVNYPVGSALRQGTVMWLDGALLELTR